MIIKLIVSLSISITLVACHGFLKTPPARQVAWSQLPGFEKYDDLTAVYCGTFDVQNYYNDGKCGVCGDDAAASTKLFEHPGKYATSKIVKTYTSGEEIEITHSVVVDSFHGGFAQVKLCPLTNGMKEATQSCLDEYVLEVLPHSRSVPGDNTKVKVELGVYDPANPAPFYEYSFKVKLPDGLVCDRCVLQWVWTNDQREYILLDTTKAKGVGRQQEFKNCADIQIKPSSKPFTGVVKKNPAKPASKLSQKAFGCERWNQIREKKKPIVRNTKPDTNVNTGQGVICWHPDENVEINEFTKFCTDAYIKCLFYKKCPEEYHCRWFE